MGFEDKARDSAYRFIAPTSGKYLVIVGLAKARQGAAHLVLLVATKQAAANSLPRKK